MTEIDESTLERIVVSLDSLEKKVNSITKEIQSLMEFVLTKAINVDEEEDSVNDQAPGDLSDKRNFAWVPATDDTHEEEEDFFQNFPSLRISSPITLLDLLDEKENINQTDIMPKSFGSFSKFDPFAEQKKPELDFSQRPIKYLDAEEEDNGVHVIYMYETKDGAETDQEDLDKILAEIDSEPEKEQFKNALENIKNGVINIVSSRDQGLHIQTLRVRDFLLEIRFNKISTGNYKGNYSKLFN